METALRDPGKPWQNGADASFNGKFRDECLSLEWFRVRVEAKVLIEQWRRHYNAARPHSSLAYLTPEEFKQQYCLTEANEAVPRFLFSATTGRLLIQSKRSRFESGVFPS